VTELLHYEIEIAAPVGVVYELLTEADGLLEWIAVEATVDARPGGVITWTHANGATVVGECVEIEPPWRLVFTYGWEADAAVGPGSTLVEITLTELGAAATRLRLVHRDLPDDEQRRSHLEGWRHFLERLDEVAVRSEREE
jgi:uncharacterized protein YndB with AHSA1/START domain